MRQGVFNGKSQPGKAKLTRNLLERASYILGIPRSLQILLPDESLGVSGTVYFTRDHVV